MGLLSKHRERERVSQSHSTLLHTFTQNLVPLCSVEEMSSGAVSQAGHVGSKWQLKKALSRRTTTWIFVLLVGRGATLFPHPPAPHFLCSSSWVYMHTFLLIRLPKIPTRACFVSKPITVGLLGTAPSQQRAGLAEAQKGHSCHRLKDNAWGKQRHHNEDRGVPGTQPSLRSVN